MNISRMCMDGSTHPEEQLNKSQLYINFFWTKHYKFEYDNLNSAEKEKIVSLLRN